MRQGFLVFLRYIGYSALVVLLLSTLGTIIYSDTTIRPLFFFALLSLLIANFAGLIFALCTNGSRIKFLRLPGNRMWVWLACVLIMISVYSTHWPIRLALHTSRPALERLADHVEKGYVLNKPQQVGLIRIYKAEFRKEVGVCIWINNELNYHPEIVRKLTPSPHADFLKAMVMALWIEIPLFDNWYLIDLD